MRVQETIRLLYPLVEFGHKHGRGSGGHDGIIAGMRSDQFKCVLFCIPGLRHPFDDEVCCG